MSKYILHYFWVNGRAQISRAILSYSKANWTNVVVKREDWPKLKTSELCEYEQLPVLEVDGKKLCESQAINLYLGETFKLMGKDAEENYQIVNLLMTFEDYTIQVYETITCTDEAKKAELRTKVQEKIKFFLGKFEKRYVELGKGKYFLGDKFTLADIYLATALIDAIDILEFKECPFKQVAPNLGELVNRVKENELKEYYEKYYIKKAN